MDAEQRIPRIPGVEDHIAYLAFLQDAKRFNKYHDDLTTQIKRLVDLIATYGKAKEIDKLHAEVQALKDSVLSDIAARESALVEEKRAFSDRMAAARKKMAKEQKTRTDKANADMQKAAEARTAAEAAQKAAEAARDAAQADREAAAKDRAAASKMRAELDAKMQAAKALQKELAG